MNMSAGMYHGNFGVSSDMGKGKGKLREADFEAAFAQAAASFSPVQAEASRIVEVGDSLASMDEAMKNIALDTGVRDGHINFDR